MKQITATKCKDKWLIHITDTRHIPCESDVLKTIRQEGCKVRKEFCYKNKDGNFEIIYAN